MGEAREALGPTTELSFAAARVTREGGREGGWIGGIGGPGQPVRDSARVWRRDPRMRRQAHGRERDSAGWEAREARRPTTELSLTAARVTWGEAGGVIRGATQGAEV